jgi:hypothetical protein
MMSGISAAVRGNAAGKIFHYSDAPRQLLRRVGLFRKDAALLGRPHPQRPKENLCEE